MVPLIVWGLENLYATFKVLLILSFKLSGGTDGADGLTSADMYKRDKSDRLKVLICVCGTRIVLNPLEIEHISNNKTTRCMT